MDFATVIGFVFGLVLMVAAILLGGQLTMFVDIPSILIVFGGTIATLFIRHRMKDVFGAFGILMKAFFFKPNDVQQVIIQIVEMATLARKAGVLALEKVKSEDVFMQKAINHCVDGVDPAYLEDILVKELSYQKDRHRNGVGIFEGIAESAPAFGMLGTIIGLVQMLVHLEDPSTIGPGLAMALISIFYGILIANLVALPISYKLMSFSKDEQMVRQVIIDGMIGILKGIRPNMLMDSLVAALPPAQRNFE
ncbi:MAG: MotA/TolQ/ExbB proton channel family protein [Magnetococcales bacterium]|nr:MotA/TolQ/ExbB proton channel family protein [Magnetococcales bacterium]